MPEPITVFVNGRAVVIPQGAVLSSALLIADIPCRLSASGQPRTALCGMGICFECRAVVDGVAHIRTCQTRCQPGMKVETQR
jgi:D-hydroxyproline dehydrogenase subunit gamma